MSKGNRQGQVGGRNKEAPLAIVGNNGLAQEQQGKVLIPQDAEYHRYSELIRGYLEKIASWRTIFEQEQYIIEKNTLHSTPVSSGNTLVSEDFTSRFDVLQTSEGLTIDIAQGDTGDARYNKNKRPERVFYAEMRYDHTLPFKLLDGEPITPTGTTMINMDFTAGLAGEHLFVDPDGKPLEQVRIAVYSFWGDTWREIRMNTQYPSKSGPQADEPGRNVLYKFKDESLEVIKRHKQLRYKNENTISARTGRPFEPPTNIPMPDEYSTALLTTIDALIPGNPAPTPQPERRGSHEPKPKRLPSPRRRRPPQR